MIWIDSHTNGVQLRQGNIVLGLTPLALGECFQYGIECTLCDFSVLSAVVHRMFSGPNWSFCTLRRMALNSQPLWQICDASKNHLLLGQCLDVKSGEKENELFHQSRKRGEQSVGVLDWYHCDVSNYMRYIDRPSLELAHREVFQNENQN